LYDILEFIFNAWWIRLSSLETLLKFGLVGLSGILVNLVCFTALLAWGMNKFIASPLAIEVSILWNFLYNNYWTFRMKCKPGHAHIRGLKFNVVSILALSISFVTFSASAFIFPDSPPQIHQLVGILPDSIVNYLLNSYWTFSPAKAGKIQRCS
jgi:dolichol-phosphate mannosyltransferase